MSSVLFAVSPLRRLVVLMRLPQLFCLCLLLLGANASVQAADDLAQIAAQLAPSGTLRAAINYGNAVLAVKNPATGELEGISVDLARELGKRLGLPVTLVPYTAARKAVDGARKNEWDVSFTGIDPQRAEDMIFTAPYLIIEGTYMVRQNSPIKTNADVDQAGVRIAVSNGSAYDLFLSRAIRNAQLVRMADPTIVTDQMMAQSLDVVAGVKQRNQADAARVPGLRLLDGNFMEIRQAVATVSGRTLAAAYLARFVEEMKASGFIRSSLDRHHVDGAAVAPPAAP